MLSAGSSQPMKCKDAGMNPSVWDKCRCFGGFLRSCSKLDVKRCLKPWRGAMCATLPCKFGFICEGDFGDIILIFPLPSEQTEMCC